jgi:hypothetical protein
MGDGDSVLTEGVQDTNTCAFEVFDVAGHEGESPHDGCGREQAIDGGHWVGDVQGAPLICDFRIDGENAISEGLDQPVLLLVQRFGCGGISTAKHLDPPPDLTEYEDAGEQLAFVGSFKPCLNSRVGAGPFSELRQHVGIEQETHRVALSQSHVAW